MRSKSVLVIDDSIVARGALRAALTGSGFHVMCAKNGCEALDCVRSCEQIDLIVTDFHMPDLNGDDLIADLRQNPRLRSTPILVLTGDKDDAAKQSVKKAGATGWILKPFDPAKLVAAIDRLTH